MHIINLGSINIDHVYAVDHLVRPGETIASTRYRVFAGGKGLNQSIALARAGVNTRHVGRVGAEGGWLLDRLRDEGIDTSAIAISNTPTGHAIIQVTPQGENAIVLFGGANHALAEADLAHALSTAAPGDCFLLQNETNLASRAIQMAHERQMRIVFNPAPMTREVDSYPLEWVDLFILNETEAEALTGATDPEQVCHIMRHRFPRASVVLTLGAHGAMYFDRDSLLHEAAPVVDVVDTTAAGDTFIGYFLAEWIQSRDPARSLHQGCRAASICVTKAGASDAIPHRADVG